MSGSPIIQDAVVVLPSFEEQKEIVRILELMRRSDDCLKEKNKCAVEQIELIKKAILAKAFRGELGTNNPDEESSTKLLKDCMK